MLNNSNTYATTNSYYTYKYHIPCYLDYTSQLNGGNYCVQIVDELVDSFSSVNYCSDDNTIKAIKDMNKATITITGFSTDQGGCVQPGESISLLATITNFNNNQNNEYMTFALSNTEVYRDDISMQCNLEIQNNGLSGKIICNIPNEDILDGYYSVYYSSDLKETNECPTVKINAFNSLDFSGKITKLKVFGGNNNKNNEANFTNITFENPSYIPGLFNLTFSLNNIQGSYSLSYTNIYQQYLGIKLINNFGTQINTKCDLIKSDYTSSIFYLICTPDSFQIETKYSLLISNNIVIGYDTSKTICTYGEKSFYSKIIIPSAEYDIFIIYNYNNKPYLDCNSNNKVFFFNNVTSPINFCGSCSDNCLMCKKANVCDKCLEGLNLNLYKECDVEKSPLSFYKFKELERFITSEDTCGDNNNYKQLFSLKYSYVITNGESFSIEQEMYNDIIYATNGNESYGLNCLIDVNPDFIQNGNNYGTCKQSTCSLSGYINCSFREKVSDGTYDIKINSYSKFEDLIRKVKSEYSPIRINYIDTQISAITLQDSIQVTFKSYFQNIESIYLCPKIYSDIIDCYELQKCKTISNDYIREEYVYECSKVIDYYGNGCISLERIVIETSCWDNINESFSYKFCPNSEYDGSDFISFTNSFIILIINLLFII